MTFDGVMQVHASSLAQVPEPWSPGGEGLLVSGRKRKYRRTAGLLEVVKIGLGELLFLN